MGEEPDHAVLIEFETPVGDLAPYHRRTLTGVPKSKAEKMAADFEAYRSSEAEVSPYELYCYEDEEGETQLVALDFTEVTGVLVQASAEGRPSVNDMPSTNGRASA